MSTQPFFYYKVKGIWNNISDKEKKLALQKIHIFIEDLNKVDHYTKLLALKELGLIEKE